MTFGIATVTFVSFVVDTAAEPDSLGHYPQAEKLTKAPGCRHRPLNFTETIEMQFDVATEIWKTTLPLSEYSASLRAKVMGAAIDDVIRVDGDEYKIVGGVRSYPDENGPFKATIISKKHIG